MDTPIISLIVAMTRERVIAIDGTMPWSHTADMKYFHDTTMGKPIIMGRKTYDSIGKPLSGRTNIVISRSVVRIPGVILVTSADDAIAVANNAPEIMVIGGAEIYALFAAHVTRMYISTMDLRISSDSNTSSHNITYFPYMPILTAWTCIEERTLPSYGEECTCKLQVYVASR